MKTISSLLKALVKTLLVIVILIPIFLLGRYSAFVEIPELLPTLTPVVSPQASPTSKTIQVAPEPQPAPQKIIWGGPELWESVNKRRVELGVNPLKQKGEFCTIASIRLNEILELGKLDAHEGFSSLPERRPDLRWIFEKYTVAEYLISGATTPEEAVSQWEHTLGHRSLLAGGEYVWGCIYASNGFAVAIAAF